MGLNALQISASFRPKGPIQGIRAGAAYECVGGPLCGQFLDLPGVIGYIPLRHHGWDTGYYRLRDDGTAYYRDK